MPNPVTRCLITIGRDSAMNPTGLHLFPCRAGDAMIFYPPVAPGRPASATTPREVEWAVNLALPGEKVIVEDGTGQTPVFPNSPFVMNAANCHVVRSGPAPHGVQNGRRTTWKYTVRLQDGAGKDLVRPLDPEIIIEEDP